MYQSGRENNSREANKGRIGQPIVMVELCRICMDGRTQARAAISTVTVEDYAGLYKAGEQLPPVDLFQDGGTFWPGDGHHRILAAREAGLTKIPAVVRLGTVRDALLFSCGSNSSHGLRRSTADKRAAVAVLLADPEWSQRSNRWIADTAKVSHTFVNSFRASTAPSGDHSGGNVSISLIEVPDEVPIPVPDLSATEGWMRVSATVRSHSCRNRFCSSRLANVRPFRALVFT